MPESLADPITVASVLIAYYGLGECERRVRSDHHPLTTLFGTLETNYDPDRGHGVLEKGSGQIKEFRDCP